MASVFLFVMCVASSLAAVIVPRKSKMLMQRPASASALNHKVSVLDLELEACGESGALLGNDNAIALAVKDSRERLFIHISVRNPNSRGLKTSLTSYISSVYSKAWDEMIVAGKCSLECIVVGELLDCNVISLPEILALPDLSSVYSRRLSTFDLCDQIRKSKDLESVVHEDTSRAYPIEPKNIYYFDSDAKDSPIPTFRRIAMGGSFDNLHNGHRKLLLLAAAACSDQLTVGITGDAMLVSKKNHNLIASFDCRRAGVEKFLLLVKPTLGLRLVELTDPFGPTISDPSIEAIVVSSETLSGAHKINSIRRERGMAELTVLVSRRADAGSMSSTFIRSQLSTNN